MPKLTLDLPEAVYRRLHAQAERHGRTIEEEARNLVLARCPAPERPAESREEILERIRRRWETMPAVTLTPEELKGWIIFGRP